MKIIILILLIIFTSCKDTSGETCFKQKFIVSGNSEVRNIKPVCTEKLFWYISRATYTNEKTVCYGNLVRTTKSLRVTTQDSQLIDLGRDMNFKEIDCSLIERKVEAE